MLRLSAAVSQAKQKLRGWLLIGRTALQTHAYSTAYQLVLYRLFVASIGAPPTSPDFLGHTAIGWSGFLHRLPATWFVALTAVLGVC